MKITKSTKQKKQQEVDVPTEGEDIVKPFGKSGAHVTVPTAWIGKRVRITLLN